MGGGGGDYTTYAHVNANLVFTTWLAVLALVEEWHSSLLTADFMATESGWPTRCNWTR